MPAISPGLPEILEKLRHAQSMLSTHRRNPLAVQIGTEYLDELAKHAWNLSQIIDKLRDTCDNHVPPFDA